MLPNKTSTSAAQTLFHQLSSWIKTGLPREGSVVGGEKKWRNADPSRRLSRLRSTGSLKRHLKTYEKSPTLKMAFKVGRNCGSVFKRIRIRFQLSSLEFQFWLSYQYPQAPHGYLRRSHRLRELCCESLRKCLCSRSRSF